MMFLQEHSVHTVALGAWMDQRFMILATYQNGYFWRDLVLIILMRAL